ncbi:MAG: GNAT family N-acetyltransferase [Vicinamibacteria bacterium]
MSSLPVEAHATELRIVDLDSVRVYELEGFFRRELALWRDRLLWDVSGAVSAFRRALDRGAVQGKAIRCGSATAGYGYFIIESGRGVLTGLAIASDWRETEIGPVLVRALIDDLERRDVERIETQFVSFESPWLVPCFEAEGFQSFWREFRRLPLKVLKARSAKAGDPPLRALESFSWNPWRAWNLNEASQLMQSAHVGGVDSRMNELYRSVDGCRALLNNVLRHRGCGAAIAEASIVVRDEPTHRAVGFALVTETAPRQAHLAQLAVAPEFQRRGVGRQLLARTIERLSDLGFGSLSLMVSGGNHRALAVYRAMGFELVIPFPVFSRDGV